jgi:hypothetical protein
VIALAAMHFEFPNFKGRGAKAARLVRHRRVDRLHRAAAGGVDAGNGPGLGIERVIGLFAIAAVMLVAFLFIETRAEEPLIPLSLFRNR